MRVLPRRSVLLRIGGVVVGTVAPAFFAWKSILQANPSAADDVRVKPDPTGFTNAEVVWVEDWQHFGVVTGYGEVEVVVPEDAQEIWAGRVGPYEPAIGDRVTTYGSWAGEPGRSPFVVQRVYFNLERIRGVLETDAEVDGDVVRFTVYSAQQGRWRVRVEPEPLTYAVVSSPREGRLPLEGMEAMRAAKKGWGIDMIGFRERDGTLLVTWAELGVPEGAGDGR